MKGRFFLYLSYSGKGWNILTSNQPQRPAKDKVARGSEEVQIYQLCGTAKKDIVII